MNEKELLERKAIGKKGLLWTIETTFKLPTGEVKWHYGFNATDDEINLYRENVFKYGMKLPVDPGHWYIIHPQDFWLIELWRQYNFFERDNFAGGIMHQKKKFKSK